jgi:hypothetical protein
MKMESVVGVFGNMMVRFACSFFRVDMHNNVTEMLEVV